MTQTISCPCGSQTPYSACCQPAIEGQKSAATAEALMRSRYTAYVLEEWRYLYNSWHPQTRPTRKSLSRTEKTDWQSLEILSTTGGQALDNKGTVEFRASWKTADGIISSLHEKSRFERLQGKWVYIDGDIFND